MILRKVVGYTVLSLPFVAIIGMAFIVIGPMAFLPLAGIVAIIACVVAGITLIED